MKTYLDCFPCMLNQALEAARVATPDPALQREILNRVIGLSADAEVGKYILKASSSGGRANRDTVFG